MSTLTSSQLHVKRSSTRLHAPPGGVSSITFGPGGLGTVDTVVEDDGIGEKAGALNPADVLQPPPRTGAYTSNNNNNSSSSGYDYAPQKGRTPGGYGSANAMSSGYGYNNNSNSNNNSNNNSWGGDPYGQLPSTGMMPQQQQQHYGAGPPTSGPPRQLSSASSSGSWGSQPPLTSSKRDQNWERKRRQWLARKNGSMGGSAVGFSGGGTSRLHSAGPPGSSSYGSNMGVGMDPWEDHGNANAPPSPLSKFMHQQSQKQHQQGDLFGYDYERIGTAQSQASFSLPQPPATAAYPRGDVYSSGGGGYPYAPPSRSGGPYNPTPPSSSGESIGPQGRMSHFNNAPPPQAASEFGYGCGGYGHYGGTVTPGSRDGPSVAGVSTSRGGNTGNRNVSSAARQPPGGHSNWSPFS